MICVAEEWNECTKEHLGYMGTSDVHQHEFITGISFAFISSDPLSQAPDRRIFSLALARIGTRP